MISVTLADSTILLFPQTRDDLAAAIDYCAYHRLEYVVTGAVSICPACNDERVARKARLNAVVRAAVADLVTSVNDSPQRIALDAAADDLRHLVESRANAPQVRTITPVLNARSPRGRGLPIAIAIVAVVALIAFARCGR